jgi:hypothetical protein
VTRLDAADAAIQSGCERCVEQELRQKGGCGDSHPDRDPDGPGQGHDGRDPSQILGIELGTI